jgi:glycine amidinotransferase
MNAEAPKTIVNSWNEWDPLKHVIVGRPDGGMIPAPEPALEVELPDVGITPGDWGPLPEDLCQKAIRQMDAFAELLASRGIRVDRPTPLDFSQRVQTPDWVQDTMIGCMPPRDLLLTVGNEILEATMSQRSRWFEYLCYRDLLEQYFREDPEFRWEAAPKPRLTDDSYVPDFWHQFTSVWTEEEKEARMRANQWMQTNKEPLFDAADVARFGKDLFVKISPMTNEPGIDWLRRHFEPRGFRLHKVAFGGHPLNWHLDDTFIAPREGLLIQNPAWMPLTPEFHELLSLNGWEIVMAAPIERERSHPYSWISVYLSYNVFSIDPKTIVVYSDEKRLADQMDKLGFDVVPLDFFDVSPFGGAFHCATLDIHREGGCEDYFPRQIPGF